MKAVALKALPGRLRCRVELDRPLAQYTTYRIGGPAAAVVHPECAEDVVEALRFATESGMPWLALGLGSNVLVSDAGFSGIVIRLGKGLDQLHRAVDGDATLWRVGAAFPTPQLARRTARAGLAGMHRLIGVPGTVGGGVYMNAGAHGEDFSQVVRCVTLVDGRCEVRSVRGADVAWRYRASGLDGVVLEVTVQLVPGDVKQLAHDVRQHFRWRQAGTPFNEACCGSVFRNPAPPPPTEPATGGHGRPRAAGDQAADGPALPSAAPGGRVDAWTAGRLIDACGLKGFRVGGAEVSRKHANYIVNTGRATAAEVSKVIEHVRETVHRTFGVELELEVKIIE